MAARTLISEKDAQLIKALIWNGEIYAKIALMLDVSQMAISNVATGKRYPEVKWPDGSDGAFPIARAKILNRTRDARRLNLLILERREARRLARLDPNKLSLEDGLAYAKTILLPDDPSDMLPALEEHIKAVIEVRGSVTQEGIEINLAQQRRIYRQQMEDRVTKNRRRKKSL